MQATLTVLFTDAVASTEALSELGDERFGVVQQEHLDLLRGPVGNCGGREVTIAWPSLSGVCHRV